MARRCTHCKCDELAHEEYWHCRLTGGDVCDICCLYDMDSSDTPKRMNKSWQEINAVCKDCGRRHL